MTSSWVKAGGGEELRHQNHAEVSNWQSYYNMMFDPWPLKLASLVTLDVLQSDILLHLKPTQEQYKKLCRPEQINRKETHCTPRTL